MGDVHQNTPVDALEALEVIEASDLKVGSAFHAFKFASIVEAPESATSED